MPPIVGINDEFEGRYREKFRSLARDQGEFIFYERDRAAIDMGIHLTRPVEKGRELSHTRVWFQLKGIRSTTLSRDEYAQGTEISLSVSLDHLKFWFASPEPTYLVVYVECADTFLVEDVRDIVQRSWGQEFIRPETFKPDQKMVTVKLSTEAELSPATWAAMRRQQSMRIDGPFFRGRPLGHRLDPLRCTLNQLEPAAFIKLVGRLLDVHGYQADEQLEAAAVFGKRMTEGEQVSLSVGTLYHTFEWVLHLETRFGIGQHGDFRIEGRPHYAQGPCSVLIEGDPQPRPDTNAARKFIEWLRGKGIRQFLVFANLQDDPGYFGTFFSAARSTGLNCVPLLLNEVAYCLLTTSMVYLEFRDAVSWKLTNYIWQDIPPSI